MDDLVAFVHACIDEDAAEIAKQPDGDGEFEGIGLWASGDVLSNTSYLIVNKTRALREVNAQRRMLDSLRHGLEDADTAWLANLVLEEWAEGCADRPGYDERWRP